MKTTGTDAFAPPTGDMSKEDFRRFGHQLIDWISDYFEQIEGLPVLSQIEPGELKAHLPTSPPETGESMAAILSHLERLMAPALTHLGHPSVLCYFPTAPSAA